MDGHHGGDKRIRDFSVFYTANGGSKLCCLFEDKLRSHWTSQLDEDFQKNTEEFTVVSWNHNDISICLSSVYSVQGKAVSRASDSDANSIRKFEECTQICERILHSQPGHKGAWVLLMQCEVEKTWINEWVDEPEVPLASHGETRSSSARPGTSIRHVNNKMGSSSRPMSNSGRPLSGIVRPQTTSLRSRTPSSRSTRTQDGLRSSHTRGSIGMVGPWVSATTLHEAAKPGWAKQIFEYILLKEGNIPKAMELAREAAKVCIRGDLGWWEEQIGRCLFLSGRLRDSRVALRTSMGMPPGGDRQPLRHDTSGSEHRTKTLSGIIRLARVDTCLDQPLAAISVCVAALESFPGNVLLLTEVARLYEAIGDEEISVKYYQNVLRNDSVNAEALACVATHHYYQEQPDMALPFYRHLLQLGLGTVEVLCNMALCYLATQQLDIALPYFFKAISLAEASGCQEALSQLWYNASHIALTIGDISLAIKCLNLCLSGNPKHSQAHNNLAILELLSLDSSDSRENAVSVIESSVAHFKSAFSTTPNSSEPAFNLVLLMEKMGNIQASHALATTLMKTQPGNAECSHILKRLNKLLSI